jgi:hypothetical protein
MSESRAALERKLSMKVQLAQLQQNLDATEREADARVAEAEKRYQSLADMWNATQAGCGPHKDLKDILKLTARGEMARQLAEKILKFLDVADESPADICKATGRHYNTPCDRCGAEDTPLTK